MDQPMTVPHSLNDAFPLYLTLQMKSNTLSGGDWWEVDFGSWPLGTSDEDSLPTIKYKVSGNIYWVPAIVTNLTATKYKI